MTFYMPLARTDDAPCFTSDHSGFEKFFESVAELAKCAGLSEIDKIRWSCRYAGSESESWRYLPSFDNPDSTFKQFRREVLRLYPHLDNNHRYTNRDLLYLIEQTQEYPQMSQNDLGSYYRQFVTISMYLVNKHRLSLCEQNTLYLRGFPLSFRARITQRLTIKKPDVFPDDGYDISNIHDAAIFLLHSDSTESHLDTPSDQISSTDPLVSNLLKAISELTSIVARQTQPSQVPHLVPPTPGGVVQNTPPRDPLPCYSQGCVFCSANTHYMADCHLVSNYIRLGKIARNDRGRIILPDGRDPTQGFPGQDLRQKVDNHWKSRQQTSNDRFQQQKSQETASPHFVEIHNNHSSPPNPT
jgi:hypothetical protein